MSTKKIRNSCKDHPSRHIAGQDISKMFLFRTLLLLCRRLNLEKFYVDSLASSPTCSVLPQHSPWGIVLTLCYLQCVAGSKQIVSTYMLSASTTTGSACNAPTIQPKIQRKFRLNILPLSDPCFKFFDAQHSETSRMQRTFIQQSDFTRVIVINRTLPFKIY